MTLRKPHRIVGLDPGLRATGWGVIDTHGNRLQYVAHGVIRTSARAQLSQRLTKLFQELLGIMEMYQPHSAAVEETFVNQNPGSTLKLGMARGVVLLAPAHHGVHVGEYAANRVKKAVVGVGHADKVQVASMVQRLLPTSGMVVGDAADALAVAICHAHYGLASSA